MGRRTRRLMGILAGGLVLVQFIRADRSNPPPEIEMPAPPEVQTILRRSCYDCHSNQTRWPWYSNVAPVSWVVARDVHQGRQHLNLSTWNRLSLEKQPRAIREIWEQVAEGEMPMSLYLPLHPDARLSADDKATLLAWAEAVGAPPGSQRLHPHK
ncbi:MAG: heme-binding domain-containing protein [Vicinamibacterales bacterium]